MLDVMNLKPRTSNLQLRTSNILHIFAGMPQQLSPQQLVQLANEFGTPLYVYHAEKISEQYDKLHRAFTGTATRFFYACKALTNISILKYVNELGAGLDCVSIYEVKLGLKAGFQPKDILYTPNCVD